ncbi:YaeQ family protein [Vibrio sp. S4M6]|uniref:YaeQ family protein n=1 Tax=Vibrio sinus TaxID=2946865 RepID=UPI00202A33DA|nr:YaeQ family protein [Vibrio sinus]MCL9780071.1 YaeQ family protein [Vibrio sinus]
MALKPTIYKFRIAVTDLNRDHYDNLNLTVAQHPSENNKRMLARVLAFCLNTGSSIAFTKGLSTVEEPDIWSHTLDNHIQLWIDVGEPDFERIKKASHKSEQVKIYTFNAKSDVWWQQNQSQLTSLSKVEVYQFEHDSIEQLAQNLSRGMDLSVMVSEQSIFVDMDSGSFEIGWKTLHE